MTIDKSGLMPIVTLRNFTSQNILIKALLVFAGLVLSFFIVEAILRGYYFARGQGLFGLRPARTTLKWQNDDITGRRLAPNQSGWFVTPSMEYATWIEVNNQGWRDGEHTLEKPENTYRILIIGDSFVENFQVPLEHTFFKQLEKNLNDDAQNKKIEIIVMGLGDSGTAQQYVILKNIGLLYQPDLVVHFFFTGNDVKNNSPTLMTDLHRPYFQLVDGELKAQPFPLPPQKYGLFSFLKTKLRLFELLADTKGKLETKFGDFGDYPIDYHVYDNEYSQDYKIAWDTTKALILESKKLTEAAGAKYLLVSLANNEQVNDKVWSQLQNIYPRLKVASVNLERPDIILKEFCKTERLECIFMLPAFLEFAKNNPDTPTHYKLDGHWTPAGTNLVTKILSERILPYISQQ